jgi:hypothetical protein
MPSFYDEFVDAIQKKYEHDDSEVLPRVYHFEYDHRFEEIVSLFFNLDSHKIAQLESIMWLLDYIQKGETKQSFKVKIIYTNKNVMFSHGPRLMFAVFNKTSLSNLKIRFHFDEFSLNELIDGTAYEKTYQERLTTLNALLPANITAKSFIHTMNLDLKEFINSIIVDNKISYYTATEFNNLFHKKNESDSIVNLDLINGSKSHEFDITNYKVQKYLSPFLSNDHLNKLNEIFSILVFKEQLDDLDFYSKKFKIEIRFQDVINKFRDEHYLYNITFTHNQKINGWQDLYITTHSDCLVYECRTEEFDYEPLCIRGIDNIYEHLKKSLLDKISAVTGIENQDLCNKSIELYQMLKI